MSALRCRDVGLALGGRAVLRGVDLDVADGEVVVLAGRNGAGKTTLLRVAAALREPDSGRVELAGRDVAGQSRRELARRVALVPQDTSVPFPFSVSEMVLMGRAPHLGWLGLESQRDHALARAALERVGVAELADRSILELSGGERQLVMMARALAQDAGLLLLDEPTAHLDLRRRLMLLELVRELAAEGRAALVVSHDLDIAARAGDRVALLADGRILAQDTPAAALRPDRLQQAFGVHAEVLTDADGSPVVVPRHPAD